MTVEYLNKTRAISIIKSSKEYCFVYFIFDSSYGQVHMSKLKGTLIEHLNPFIL